MKGHYSIKSTDKRAKYSKNVKCTHPLFSAYTVFTKENKGIGVIQQRFNPTYKYSWWGPIDVKLSNDIFENQKFSEWFFQNAKEPDTEGLFPTIEIRKLMYALGMKPLKKEPWETSFKSQFLQSM